MRLVRGKILYLIALCLIFTGGFSCGYIVCVFQPGKMTDILKDNTVIAWAGVGVNLAVVFVALFMSVLQEHLRRPRFKISCGQKPPWQIRGAMGEGSNKERLYLRLRVENSGLSPTEACEVRLETIDVVKYQEGNEVCRRLEHDPRPLKWIGRDCSHIQLSPGAFDLVDLGTQNEDWRENFRIAFHERGYLDLNLVENEAEAYILKGNVYGMGAFPQEFAFRITWSVADEALAIQISEVK